jgi:hypothetical protein
MAADFAREVIFWGPNYKNTRWEDELELYFIMSLESESMVQIMLKTGSIQRYRSTRYILGKCCAINSLNVNVIR